MLPKSRRALTIQEIAALARSSLHGNCSPRGSSGKGASPEVEESGPPGGGLGVTCLEFWGGPGDYWWHSRGGHGGARSHELEIGNAGFQGYELCGEDLGCPRAC